MFAGAKLLQPKGQSGGRRQRDSNAGDTGRPAQPIEHLTKKRLLEPITLERMPLSKKPDRKSKIDHWAEPKYWAEVDYRDITSDGLLRHVTFRGLYPTKSAKKPLVAKFK